VSKKIPKPASKAAIGALQVLYSLWRARNVPDFQNARDERLSWASESIGREIASFKELTSDEARRLIDVLKISMGQDLTRQPQPWRRIRSRDRAYEAGTAGKKGLKSCVIQLVSPDDLARIDEALDRLGWTQERFLLWLQSPTSPLRKADKTIRTVADANRVWWALKAIMIRAGKWSPEGVTRSTG
jgi:hypothetical protein